MYRLEDAGGTEYWLTWDSDVDVVRGPVADPTGQIKRIYFTSDEFEPRVATLEMASEGTDTVDGSDIYPASYGDTGTNYPLAWYVLGVHEPVLALVVGSPSGGTGTDEERAYVYTYVSPWGEESAPSPPSNIETGKPDGTWPLSGIGTAPINTGTIVGAIHASGVVRVSTDAYHWQKRGHMITIASISGMTDINDDYRVQSALLVTATTVSRERTSNVVTLELSNVTDLEVGMTVIIAGVGGSDYNGTVVLDSVDTGTLEIVYTQTGGNEVNTADTGGTMDHYSFTITETTAQSYTSGGTWKRHAPYNVDGMVKRIYRSLRTTSGISGYFYVAEIAAATTTYSDTATISEIANNETLNLDATWDMPPGYMHGIVSLPNGFHAGFVGNEVFFSEPDLPYAYPTAYGQLVDYPVVGLGVFESTVVVATSALPYEIHAVHPESASLSRIELVYPCLSKKSLVSHGYGVMYQCDKGLVLIAGSTKMLVTKDFYTRDEWDLLDIPAGGMVSMTFDDRYMGFWTNSDGDSEVVIYDPFEQRSIITQNDQAVTGVWNDPETGVAYILDDDDIQQWDADLAYRQQYEWKSKKFKLPKPINLAACRIDADFTLTPEESDAITTENAAITAANAALIATIPTGVDRVDPLGGSVGGADVGAYEVGGDALTDLLEGEAQSIQFQLFAGGVLKFTKEIDTALSFRLPAGYKSDEFEVLVSGNAGIFSIKLAESMKELGKV